MTAVTSRHAAGLAALALALTGVVACGTDDPATRGGAEPSTSPGPSAPPPVTGTREDRSNQDEEEEPMRVEIEVGGERLSATLDDSPAARDLAAQLPVEVDMGDHGGVEKTGRLPRPLSTQGQPDIGDPAVGDLGYYAPGQDLVLYYGDQSAYPGIVVLGRLSDGAAEAIAAMDGDVSATVTQAAQ